MIFSFPYQEESKGQGALKLRSAILNIGQIEKLSTLEIRNKILFLLQILATLCKIMDTEHLHV